MRHSFPPPGGIVIVSILTWARLIQIYRPCEYGKCHEPSHSLSFQPVSPLDQIPRIIAKLTQDPYPARIFNHARQIASITKISAFGNGKYVWAESPFTTCCTRTAAAGEKGVNSTTVPLLSKLAVIRYCR